jgi:serine/threonine protein kinase
MCMPLLLEPPPSSSNDDATFDWTRPSTWGNRAKRDALLLLTLVLGAAIMTLLNGNAVDSLWGGSGFKTQGQQQGQLVPSPSRAAGVVDAEGNVRVGRLVLSPLVLGYGCHGTIVYRGTLVRFEKLFEHVVCVKWRDGLLDARRPQMKDRPTVPRDPSIHPLSSHPITQTPTDPNQQQDGRPVAVKRMLRAFHAAADREMRLLIESDGHPNVVRYFLREQAGDFVYLVRVCIGCVGGRSVVFFRMCVSVCVRVRAGGRAVVFSDVCICICVCMCAHSLPPLHTSHLVEPDHTLTPFSQTPTSIIAIKQALELCVCSLRDVVARLEAWVRHRQRQLELEQEQQESPEQDDGDEGEGQQGKRKTKQKKKRAPRPPPAFIGGFADGNSGSNGSSGGSNSSGAAPLPVRAALQQIASGVAHLHSLRIVHRDLKPHNILLSASSSSCSSSSSSSSSSMEEGGGGLVLEEVEQLAGYVCKISDMGVGKLLAMGQSSFGASSFSAGINHHNLALHHQAPPPQQQQPNGGGDSSSAGSSSSRGDASSSSVPHGPGSVGWQAPEVMMGRLAFLGGGGLEGENGDGGVGVSGSGAGPVSSSSRRTQAVDVFSLGCVFYTVLVPGAHPFGAWYERERNILTGEPDLAPLEASPDAHDLVEAMLQRDPARRPTARMVLGHPFFWDDERRLAFLVDFSDRLELEAADSLLVLAVEAGGADVVGRAGWDRRLHKALLEDGSRYRKYDTASVRFKNELSGGRLGFGLSCLERGGRAKGLEANTPPHEHLHQPHTTPTTNPLAQQTKTGAGLPPPPPQQAPPLPRAPQGRAAAHGPAPRRVRQGACMYALHTHVYDSNQRVRIQCLIRHPNETRALHIHKHTNTTQHTTNPTPNPQTPNTGSTAISRRASRASSCTATTSARAS